MARITIIKAQPRQTLIAKSTADVLFFGGSKGGGKSRALLMEAARGFSYAGYNATIFRRIYRELKGLYEESREIYKHLGGVETESKYLWKFPNGSTIQFAHLQHDKDAHVYSGRQNAYFGVDEAQRFTAKQFWTLLSCLRSTCGAKPRIILTLNPDPSSWVLEFAKPFLDQAGFPIPELVGQLRYFGRKDGKFRIYTTREEAQADGVDGASSFTFVSSTLWDNQILLRGDPTYLERLRTLPPVERSQYLDGCWFAQQRAGEMIQSQWMPVLHDGKLARRTAGQPDDRDIIRWTLCADLAGTAVDNDLVPSCKIPRYAQSSRNADWTRIFLLGQFRDSRVVVWAGYGYRDVPGAILEEIKRILRDECPRGTVFVVSTDPGQAGVHQIESYAKELRGLARVETTQPLNLIYSANYLARVAFSGLLMLRDPDVSQSWQPALIRELEGYSSDGHSATGHDDQVSALSTGLIYLATKSHPRVIGALPSLDGPMSGENAIRTKPHWKALHPEREFGHDFR